MMLQRSLMLLSLLCLTAPTAHAQNLTIAVLKVDVGVGLSGSPDTMAATTRFQEALREELRSEYQLAPQGGDFSVSEGLTIVQCDDPSPDCLDALLELIKSDGLIYASLAPAEGTLELNVVWYIKGEGIRRQLTERVSSAVALNEATAGVVKRVVHGETGTLVVKTNVNGAEVLVDGKTMGFTPFEDSLPVGTYTVTVQREGYVEQNKEVVVAFNARARLEFELEEKAYEPPPGQRESALLPVSYGLLGVGGALLVGSAVTFALTFDTQSEFDDLIKVGEPSGDDINEASRLKANGELLASATNALFWSGAALTATGLTLLIVGLLEEPDSESNTDTAIYVLPSLGGASVYMRF